MSHLRGVEYTADRECKKWERATGNNYSKESSVVDGRAKMGSCHVRSAETQISHMKTS